MIAIFSRWKRTNQLTQALFFFLLWKLWKRKSGNNTWAIICIWTTMYCMRKDTSQRGQPCSLIREDKNPQKQSAKLPKATKTAKVGNFQKNNNLIVPAKKNYSQTQWKTQYNHHSKKGKERWALGNWPFPLSQETNRHINLWTFTVCIIIKLGFGFLCSWFSF